MPAKEGNKMKLKLNLNLNKLLFCVPRKTEINADANSLNINFLIIILMIFCVFLFSNSLKAAAMKSNNYIINKMLLSQINPSIEINSANYTVQSSIDTNLGNVSAESDMYTILVSKTMLDTAVAASTTLENAHVYPNPCRVYDGDTEVKFTYLTSTVLIKIYTISGNLVRTINKSNFTNQTSWDLKNNEGENVASGIYVYFIKYRNMIKKGKIVVIK